MQVDLSTLIEVSIQFKDDIDSAADYVMQNVLPDIIIPDPSHPNPNDDLYIHGHQLAFDDTRTQLGLDPELNDTNLNSVHFDQNNNEKADNLMAKQLKESSTGLCPDVFDASTSGQNCVPEEFSSDYILADSQLHASLERTLEISASEGDMSLHDDGSPHVTLRSSYSVNLKSLDNVVADEHYKKNALMSNVAAISEMLQEVELNEEETKHAILEANQAGNDILVKVEELKEMTTLLMEDNNKVAGEIFAEKSILATEAQELQTRLFNISEETKSFVVTIDELRQLLNDRGHAVDALHGEMIGIFDCITQLKLRVDMQLPVDEPLQQAPLILSSSAVDKPLQQAPSILSDKQLQQAPSILSSSAVDKPLQQAPSILSRSAVNEPQQQVPPILAFDEDLDQVASMLSSSTFFNGIGPLQLDSSRLSSSASSASDKSLAESIAPKSSAYSVGPLQLVSSRLSSSASSASDKSLAESIAPKTCASSASELSTNLMDDELIAGVCGGDFALDDSWDVVDDEDTIVTLC
ncbi:hypothetical protein PVAP13_3NG075300 [Panicum virgatum]|uniref:Uncharacterized protein n=1 Tax=Panicum virgatum TaxID=38727 RepID=A0A8T0UAY1_PANVG|nr:hypothetical protein PVAP13_3NG075300 [Panicum virgatum]